MQRHHELRKKYQNAGRGDKIAEARRRTKKHGDDFAALGDHSANLEARRSFFRGSRRLSTPSLVSGITDFKLNSENKYGDDLKTVYNWPFSQFFLPFFAYLHL